MSAFEEMTRPGFCLCCGIKMGSPGVRSVCNRCERTCRRRKEGERRCLHAPTLPDPRPRRTD